MAAPPLADLGGWRAVFATISAGETLPPDLAEGAISSILDGGASPAQIGGFLVGLATRGLRGEEVAAMVEGMLAAAEPLELADPAATVDIVGTGGSRLRQDRAFNISTTACFVTAAAGVPVCKHGNRRASSSSGSTDVLEALGLEVDLDGPAVARCVAEAGLGFAFARRFHPAMRHAAPVRAELGIPTVFNVLGPLSHPGGVTRQVVGVADPALAPLVIDVAARRGAPRAMVVHGSDGLDELTLSGPSLVWELRDGEIEQLEIHPARLGLTPAVVEDIGVGGPEENAAAVREVLAGVPGPRREVVLLNAAAGLVVGGAVDDLADGIEVAAAAIDGGAAAALLDRMVTLTRS